MNSVELDARRMLSLAVVVLHSRVCQSARVAYPLCTHAFLIDNLPLIRDVFAHV